MHTTTSIYPLPHQWMHATPLVYAHHTFAVNVHSPQCEISSFGVPMGPWTRAALEGGVGGAEEGFEEWLQQRLLAPGKQVQ